MPIRFSPGTDTRARSLIVGVLVFFIVMVVIQLALLRDVQVALANCPAPQTNSNAISEETSLLETTAQPDVLSTGETLHVTFTLTTAIPSQVTQVMPAFSLVWKGSDFYAPENPVEIYRSVPATLTATSTGGTATVDFIVPTLPAGSYEVLPVAETEGRLLGQDLQTTPASITIQSSSVSPAWASGLDVSNTAGTMVALSLHNQTGTTVTPTFAGALYEGNSLSDSAKIGNVQGQLTMAETDQDDVLKLTLPADPTTLYKPILVGTITWPSYTQTVQLGLSGSGDILPEVSSFTATHSGMRFFGTVTSTVCLSLPLGIDMSGVHVVLTQYNDQTKISSATLSNLPSQDNAVSVQDTNRWFRTAAPNRVELQLYKGSHLISTQDNNLL